MYSFGIVLAYFRFFFCMALRQKIKEILSKKFSRPLTQFFAECERIIKLSAFPTYNEILNTVNFVINLYLLPGLWEFGAKNEKKIKKF